MAYMTITDKYGGEMIKKSVNKIVINLVSETRSDEFKVESRHTGIWSQDECLRIFLPVCTVPYVEVSASIVVYQ